MALSPRSWSALALLRKLRSFSKAQYAAAAVAGFVLSAVLGLSGAFFLLLLLSLPVVAFFSRVLMVQTQYEITDREVAQLVVTFGGGMFPGTLVAIAWELALAPLFAILCFYDQSDAISAQLHDFLDDPIAETNDPTATPMPPHAGRLANVLQTLQVEKTLGFYVFVLLSAYVVAGLVEEATKLWIVQGKCVCNCSKKPGRGWLCDPRRLLLRRVDHANHHVVIVLAVTAAALGFSTLETAAFTFAAPTFSDRLQTAIVRSIVSFPIHGVCGAITGTRLARALLVPSAPDASALSSWRQKSWVLYPSVLVHGTFDLQIFLVSSFVSTAAAEVHPFLYDVLIPGVLSLGVIYGAIKLGQQQWRDLEEHTSGNAQYAHLGADQDDQAGDDGSDGEGDETGVAKLPV